VAANGGLISNLKIWENISLPLWYHSKRDIQETEKNVEYWLTILAIDPADCADFMGSPPHSVEPWQRKLAGLLRALVQMPRVLVVDAGLFEDVKTRIAQVWITALENYASQDRAVLVLADKATVLPWQKIE
jgi:phospholipid/cholesterol/gamma-HCH transport system ATP-binding protein